MNATPYWNGVRMRTTSAAADPDQSARRVTLPADWDDDAAAALVQLAQNDSDAVSFAGLASSWIDRMTGAGPRGDEAANGEARSLAWLLLLRQAAPTAPVWNGEHDRRPGFIVNLSAFTVPGEGFAAETFVAALRLVCNLMRRQAQDHGQQRNGELPFFLSPPPTSSSNADQDDGDIAPRAIAGEILLTNLDACLANLGFDYDSENGRDAACALASLTTFVAHENCGNDSLPLPPARSVIPGLAAVARDAWSRASENDHHLNALIETGFSLSGPVDALLGVESCGLAPVFSPLHPDGRLAASTCARLAARNLSPEAAFAAQLAGETVLTMPGPKAHLTMYKALTGFVDRMPIRPDPAPPVTPRILPRGVARRLPDRHGGIMQKASVGGHRVFLRTGEFEDGTPGEIAITPGRESPMVRGLMDCFSEAVSIGLQYGAPLEEYVQRFAYSCFGPAGTVEGDPVAAYATSLLDYAFRALSDIYLDKRLPDAPHSEDGPDSSPLLPMELPEKSPASPSHRTGLRLVV
ncbi:MAG: vitamin B12-dependent ribonucleotide reductase [Acetobacter sp.]|jgi:hypothetical protein|nr:vitamin B12-dependent ribonucleotide reductase [Acetobacter sp.]